LLGIEQSTSSPILEAREGRLTAELPPPENGARVLLADDDTNVLAMTLSSLVDYQLFYAAMLTALILMISLCRSASLTRREGISVRLWA